MPWPGGLHEKFTSHSSGSWEVQHQGVGKVGFILRPLLLAFRWLPSHCVLIWQREREREQASSLKSLLKRTLILSDQGPILITSFNFN